MVVLVVVVMIRKVVVMIPETPWGAGVVMQMVCMRARVMGLMPKSMWVGGEDGM